MSHPCPVPRRGFLAALVGLLARAAAGETAAASVPAPPPARPDPERHNSEHARYDCCRCDDCATARWRRGSHPAHVESVIALTAAKGALRRLVGTHCEGGIAGCDVCADADGCLFAVEYGVCMLEGDLYKPDDFDRRLKAARRKTAEGPAGPAATIALYDCLDALLDLVTGHCSDRDCSVCLDADGLVYHVRLGIDMLDNGLPLSAEVEERAALSAERKLARNVEPGTEMPHCEREHAGAAEQLASSRQLAQFLARKEMLTP